MKSEFFKSKSSQIRGVREKQPKKSVNWDRVVYLSMLTVGLVTLLYFLFDYNMVLKGEGRVYANEHVVRFPVDVRIVDLFVEEGDSVAANDSLFTFVEAFQPQSPKQYREEQRQISERLLDLKSAINTKRAELESVADQLVYYHAQKELVEKEIKLDLSSFRDLRAIEQKIVAMNAQMTVDSEKLNAFYQQKAFVEAWKNTTAVKENYSSFVNLVEELPGEATPLEGTFEPTIYAAPVEGVIDQIEKSSSELAVRSESILTIRRKVTDVFIQVIFPRNSLREVEQGDFMNIEFDNGVKSKGLISGFYTPKISNWDMVGIAEYELNDYVLMRLNPTDDNSSDIWEANSNIGVTVSKITF